MVLNVTKISQKMKNKTHVEYRKRYHRMRKNGIL